MTTAIDFGTTGAKRATWRRANPRELLARIITENREKSAQAWRDLFWHEIGEDGQMLRAIAEYWLDHNLRSLTDDNRDRDRTARRTAIQDAKTQVMERIGEQAKIVLLDLVMPNGKTLADCTGADCRRFGGVFSQIAQKVPARQLVGAVLSETQVRRLWQSQS